MSRLATLRLAASTILLAALSGCAGVELRAPAVALTIAADAPQDAEPPSAPQAPRAGEAGAPAAAPVQARAAAAIRAIKTRDAAALAAIAHPRKGIRFSPYSFVDKARDVTLTRGDLRGAFSDGAVRTWGSYDGEGSKIQLRFSDYYDQFVYDVDFEDAPRVGVDRAPTPGNAPDNAVDAYPGAAIVEYYFPGFNPAYEGMDWRSLKLVFERFEAEYYLVGVIHAQWMI